MKASFEDLVINAIAGDWFITRKTQRRVKAFTASSGRALHPAAIGKRKPVDRATSSRQGDTIMVTLILLLAAVTGLGLRLARWVERLPTVSIHPMRTGAE